MFARTGVDYGTIVSEQLQKSAFAHMAVFERRRSFSCKHKREGELLCHAGVGVGTDNR